MGEAYPDLYAAIGVHSGLACGAAHDMVTAFAAMQRGAPGHGQAGRVPAIVFHGDRDTTVNPSNADAVVAQFAPANLTPRTEEGRAPDGHAYTRTLYTDAAGRTCIEQWRIHGAAHAWSGGSPAGSFTDPQGPDATAQMLRFFLDHPRPSADR
jgi:poly(3-hydroxybutyrate) depolymerase